MPDGFAIQTVNAPHILTDFPVAFHQCGVQSIGKRFGVAGVFLLHPRIELLGLLLRDTVVEVARRGLYQVFPIGFVHTLGLNIRIENDGNQLITEIFHRFVFLQRQQGWWHFRKSLTQKMFGKVGDELLATIMVIDAVGEPNAFQIDNQGLEVGILARTYIIYIKSFKDFPDAQIIFAILTERDVTSPKSGFRKAVD